MVTMNDDGSVTFRMYAPRAEYVELLTDFTGWAHGVAEMSRDDGDMPGWWRVTLHAPAGEHGFCYLVDGRCWMPDYAAHGVRRNEFGNWVSLLRVPSVPEVRVAGDAEESHAIVHVGLADALKESWRIDGSCKACLPWAG